MLGLVTSLLPSLFKIGDKMIPDQDKRMEYAFNIQKFTFDFMTAMLAAKTYPWVDALVKLAYASEQIIKGLFRPVVSAGLFIYALYDPSIIKTLIDMGVVGQTGAGAMLGAFPAWMVDRHMDKKAKKKAAETIEEDW